MPSAEYGPEFYQKRHEKTLKAAETILPLLFQYGKPQSLIDVGCGVGTWLAAAHQLGVSMIRGVEGPWVQKEWMVVEPGAILQQDLEERITFQARFDVAMSLEVAEHLTKERGETFVEDLCALSDVVLFSAAVHGQGGRGPYQ